MDDATTITVKPGTEKNDQSTSVTVSEPAQVQITESKAFNVSIRGWLALFSLWGLTAVIILNQMTGKAPEANLLAAFVTTAGMICAQYMGQNSQTPKKLLPPA